MDRHKGLKAATHVWRCMPRQILVCCDMSVLAPIQPRPYTLHVIQNTLYVYGRWSFPAALASTAWPTANKTASEIFWSIVKWSLNLFCHCFQTRLPSGEFSNIVSTAPLCQWKGGNGFLFLLNKGRKLVNIFFPKLLLYVIHNLYSADAQG
jgi:hypothetical protein